jgi:hypothetical protein
MATAAHDLTRLTLPTRIRAKKAGPDGLSARLELADRIAALPGVSTEDHDATVPRSVDVFLRARGESSRKQWPEVLLCTINSDGIWIYGLDDGDRHQILLRRWGRLQASGVLLFLPRDDEELEVCWMILQRAYRRLDQFSTQARPGRAAWKGDLPRFSRTSLQ